MIGTFKNMFGNQSSEKAKKKPRVSVAFSCVVDKDEKFYKQSLVWYWSLKYFVGIEEKDIYIHFTPGCDEALISYFSDLGVNVYTVPVWSDKSPPLNKLNQVNTKELGGYDYVVLSDCDKVYFESILDWLKGDSVKACFFVAKPPFRVFQKLYDYVGVSGTRFVFRPVANDESDPRTPPNNVNGGTYIIPKNRWGALCKEWVRMTDLLLDKITIMEGWRRNIDQVAFCLAMDSLDWDVVELPKYFDLGVNVKLPPRGIDSAFHVGAIHYHGALDNSANIVPGEECHPVLAEKISAVNEMLNREIKKCPVMPRYLKR